MKYIFNEDINLSITDRILELNNITKKDLDVSNFKVDYNLKVINEFKEKLLSYKDKKFLIVGDYDCDGICSTTIIKKLFDEIGIANNYYIPSRTKEGYGLNSKIIENAHNNNFDCLLLVDNGIAASEQLKMAKEFGLIVFIIDHHEYEDDPLCEAFLHPYLFPDEYNQMCAGGLCALLANSFNKNEFYTALGGLATVADMVNIFNYNRYIALLAQRIIADGKIEPINYLLDGLEASFKNIEFSIIPKINAVSRLDDLLNVNYVVRFLLSRGQQCREYYFKIENINAVRKNYSKRMYEQALTMIDNSKNVIVIASDKFKPGLCGLVANRLLEQYKKPVIVFSQDGNKLNGSARSVPGTNLYDYLKDVEGLFEAYGGHELAVGITINSDNYDSLIAYIDSHELKYDEPYSDVIVLKQDSVDIKTLFEIESLEPYGSNFKLPLFAIRYPQVLSKTMAGGKYPKYDFNRNFSAISFNTNLDDRHYKYMIGKFNKDKYYVNKLNLVIEELV